jgi:Fe-S oxidoreductase
VTAQRQHPVRATLALLHDPRSDSGGCSKASSGCGASLPPVQGAGTSAARKKEDAGWSASDDLARRQRKVVLFPGCLSEYSLPCVADSAVAVLEKQGVEVVTRYPACCSMPKMETGDIAAVAAAAKRVRHVDVHTTVVHVRLLSLHTYRIPLTRLL